MDKDIEDLSYVVTFNEETRELAKHFKRKPNRAIEVVYLRKL
ncbi:MAG: hypothetical protein V1818_00675 [Candidatus Aenigmatarchaeota archaeon]